MNKKKNISIKRALILLSSLMVTICLLAPFSFAKGDKIIIAIDTTKPPMEFLDREGKFAGFEIDFIKAMAEEVGFTPVFQKVAWKDIFTGLIEGKYDAICASVSITKERQEMFSFSTPYINIAQAVIVTKQSNIETVADLNGKKIAVKSGTTSLIAAKHIPEVATIEYPTVEEAVQALQEGTVDAVVCDGPVAAFYVSEKQGKGVKIATLLQGDTQEQYGMVVRPNDKQTLATLNKGIAVVRRQLIDIDLQKKWLAALLSAEQQ